MVFNPLCTRGVLRAPKWMVEWKFFFGPKTMLGPKSIFSLKQNLGPKIFLGQKKIWFKKNLGPKCFFAELSLRKVLVVRYGSAIWWRSRPVLGFPFVQAEQYNKSPSREIRYSNSLKRLILVMFKRKH